MLSLSVSAQEPAYKIGFVNTARVLKEAPQARKVEEAAAKELENAEAAEAKELDTAEAAEEHGS